MTEVLKSDSENIKRAGRSIHNGNGISSLGRNGKTKDATPLLANGKRKYNGQPGKKQKQFLADGITGIFDDVILRTTIATSTDGPFDLLSDEVILHIFNWLPQFSLSKCAQVCKRWRRLSYDETLWKFVHISRKRVSQKALEMFIIRGAVALCLAMVPIEEHSSLWWSVSPPEKFSKLQYLDFTMAVIPTFDLVQILRVCNKLIKVSLEKCALNDDVCSQLAANANLEELNMCMCKGFSCDGIGEIALCCLRLRSWNLAWTGLDKSSLTVLGSTIPVAIEKLDISGCNTNLDDEGLKLILQRCPKLTELDISDAHLLTKNSISVIMMLELPMKHLSCSRCYSIKPVAYLLLGHLPHLQKLDVFFAMKDASLDILKKAMPHVKINESRIGTIARPMTGHRRSSIWGVKIRDW